jgi:hypothetical protein
MPTRNHLLPLLLLAVAIVPARLRAQYAHDLVDESRYAPTPRGVLIAAKGGVVLTTPRQVFPSLRIGDSQEGSGEISSRFGEMGTGYRVGIDLLFPFTDKLALATEFGMQAYSARYAADGARPAMRLDVQRLQAAGSLQGSLYLNPEAFERGGLRAVYIGGGLDIGVKTLANRVEGGVVLDSASAPAQGSGSFQNNDPFRTLVGLRFAGGARFGFDDHMEFSAEASYALALNSVFSSEVVRDNSFTVDNLALQVGIGYRF